MTESRADSIARQAASAERMADELAAATEIATQLIDRLERAEDLLRRCSGTVPGVLLASINDYFREIEEGR